MPPVKPREIPAAAVTAAYYDGSFYAWDVAAGLLLVKEAGGEISDFSGKDCSVPTVFGPQTLAANGRLNRAMLSVIRRELRQGSPRSSLPARRRAASARA